MAFNVSNFRAALTYDGARPSLFRVKCIAPAWVGLPVEKFTFLARAASIPSSQVGERIVDYFGQAIKLAGDRTYPDYELQVINDESFDIHDAFERWHNGISQYSRTDAVRVDGASSNPLSYTGTVLIEQFGKEGNIIKTYELVNAWVGAISGIALDWRDSNNIEEFSVSFKYDYFITNSVS
jgi:hypothetical protein